jgi:hypothetical protein
MPQLPHVLCNVLLNQNQPESGAIISVFILQTEQKHLLPSMAQAAPLLLQQQNGIKPKGSQALNVNLLTL